MVPGCQGLHLTHDLPDPEVPWLRQNMPASLPIIPIDAAQPLVSREAKGWFPTHGQAGPPRPLPADLFMKRESRPHLSHRGPA